jgi:hypothetical protein
MANKDTSLEGAFMSGILIATVAWLATFNFVDTSPKEAKMEDKCITVTSSLKSYDSFEFICRNGATFQR